MTTRILGIDPGTGRLGFGVIEVIGRKSTLVSAGVITTSKDDPHEVRLEIIYNDLSLIIDECKPSIMSIEKLFFAQNVTTAMTVSQARGVVLLLGAQRNMKVLEFTPLQIKQSLTGYGRAEKRQIQEMVRLHLGLKENPEPDDCADALAAAILAATHLENELLTP